MTRQAEGDPRFRRARHEDVPAIAMVLWAIEQARVRGRHLVQLATDRRRPDALRFYESLGFRLARCL